MEYERAEINHKPTTTATTFSNDKCRHKYNTNNSFGYTKKSNKKESQFTNTSTTSSNNNRRRATTGFTYQRTQALFTVCNGDGTNGNYEFDLTSLTMKAPPLFISVVETSNQTVLRASTTNISEVQNNLNEDKHLLKIKHNYNCK
ncbi:hypothetical protein EVAR_73528_1 [Eumeta japonica]|uniref:Uncharacterized protein n=1 Tax=Eumeta variegata TaxID=151549 RepID=A0A4C1SXZ0_EUMVA|nr:hypothetical protein EVAR_73528_1 [Eumeta japonica]